MAMLGCREVGIDEPRGCKKLIVYAEIDRCATDAVQAVTGCSLGKRTLKVSRLRQDGDDLPQHRDRGKRCECWRKTTPASWCRCMSRTAPIRETHKNKPIESCPKKRFSPLNRQRSNVPAQEMPGYRGKRVECARCGEGINFNREVELAGRALCIPCSQEELRSNGHGSGAKTADPKVLLIVGYKKVGKTTLIERLIPELSRRGYRVGTVKHHHSDFPCVSRYRGYRHLETSPSRRGERRLGDANRRRRCSATARVRFPSDDIVVGVGRNRYCLGRRISRGTAR